MSEFDTDFDEGSILEIDVEIVNNSEDQITDDVELLVDGEVVETEEFSVSGKGTDTVTFLFDTEGYEGSVIITAETQYSSDVLSVSIGIPEEQVYEDFEWGGPIDDRMFQVDGDDTMGIESDNAPEGDYAISGSLSSGDWYWWEEEYSPPRPVSGVWYAWDVHMYSTSSTWDGRERPEIVVGEFNHEENYPDGYGFRLDWHEGDGTFHMRTYRFESSDNSSEHITTNELSYPGEPAKATCAFKTDGEGGWVFRIWVGDYKDESFDPNSGYDNEIQINDDTFIPNEDWTWGFRETRGSGNTSSRTDHIRTVRE